MVKSNVIMSEDLNKIVVFQEKGIRRVWHKDEWYYSIIDIIEVLSESPQPSRYWNELRRKMQVASGNAELFANTEKLKMKSLDGKMRKTDAASREGILRIIQSIPSPKAEPFKQWLAQVGEERLAESEDPQKALERAREYYRKLGYNEKWINQRIANLVVRGELTGEWKERGVKGNEYAILTDTIHQGAFDMSTRAHKSLKELRKSEKLRDNMTLTELAITLLGEAATHEFAVGRDAQGFDENHTAAKDGGEIAGDARRKIEDKSGRKVASRLNFRLFKKNRELKGRDEEE